MFSASVIHKTGVSEQDSIQKAKCFEENIFATSTSDKDYTVRIEQKMVEYCNKENVKSKSSDEQSYSDKAEENCDKSNAYVDIKIAHNYSEGLFTRIIIYLR